MGDKPQRPSPRVWTRIGCTKKGQDIYRSILGNYAVERDHKYLAGPTEEEKKEIKRLEWLAKREKGAETEKNDAPSTGENCSD